MAGQMALLGLYTPVPGLNYHRRMSGAKPGGDARAWVRDTVHARGTFGALRHYAAGLKDMLIDLTPQRRRSRFGDIDYDFDHGVDTTWATVSLRTRLREWLSGGQYQPSEPQLFHDILRAVPAKLDGFTFIDLGSGKGRTLLMASDFPFRRIVGVEILVELDAIAQQNIARYGSKQQQCHAIESRPGDAREFAFPAEPTVLYLFNPFPEHVLRAVLANLHDSLLTVPRAVYVIYHNLVYEKTFNGCMWLHPVHRTTQFAIYRAKTG